MESQAVDTVSPKPRITGYEIAAWILMACGIVFTLYHHLLPALLGGLLVYAMVHRIALHLVDYKITGQRGKVLAVVIVSVVLIAISTGIVIALLVVLKGHAGGMHEMTEKLKEIISEFRTWLIARGFHETIPEAEAVQQWSLAKIQEYTTHNGVHTGKQFIHALVGIVIGALLSFRVALPTGPLSAAITERADRFATAFKQVVFAQFKISALNTAFTAIYLLVLLPLWGVHLPFRSTLIGVTFVAGLLPVIGNLISNTVIVLISLSIGTGVAIASLIFLVVIHKLEYFLNAKIVGTQINASAWEILLAMLCFEAAFGIPGVIIAPIVYAYAKKELKDKQLI